MKKKITINCINCVINRNLLMALGDLLENSLHEDLFWLRYFIYKMRRACEDKCFDK